jgi:glycosyltransferase involved in cell wall biosynthesis
LKTLLLISHSSNLTGGGEDDFQKLLVYLHDKYKIYTIFPKGDRGEIFKMYSERFLETEGRIFPFTEFKLKEYIGFFLKNIRKLYSIYLFIKRNKDIDLCLLNSSVCFIEAIPIVIFKIPYILSVKEKINPFLTRKIVYLFYGYTAKKIVTISKFLQKEISYIIKKKNVDLIYSTIDEKYFDKIVSQNCKNNEAVSKSNFTILSIGSIYPMKGQHILIKALLKLKKQNIKTEFIGRIIDVKYFSDINKLLNKSDVSDDVTFSGELNKLELINKILSSDCIIVTSKEEGQSLVILEALYLEKPIITTKVGIANEIIKNNVNGLLYDYNDVDTLCELILKLKNDKNLYEYISSNCKSTYNNNISSGKSMKQYEIAIKDILEM